MVWFQFDSKCLTTRINSVTFSPSQDLKTRGPIGVNPSVKAEDQCLLKQLDWERKFPLPQLSVLFRSSTNRMMPTNTEEELLLNSVHHFTCYSLLEIPPSPHPTYPEVMFKPDTWVPWRPIPGGLFRNNLSPTFICLFIYLAAPGLSCSTWDLVPQPGIEPRLPALRVRSLSHWTTREVPQLL